MYQAIKDLQVAGLDIEYKGDIEVYLGVNFDHLQDGKIKLLQPHIIQDIINQVHFRLNAATRHMPMLATEILKRNVAAPNFNGRFHYYGAIGRLNFLEKSICHNICVCHSPVCTII